VRHRGAAKVRHVPGVQVDQPAGDFPLMAGNIVAWLNLNGEFLTQLANQSLLLRFTRFHFAPGQFPHSRLIGMLWPLGQ